MPAPLGAWGTFRIHCLMTFLRADAFLACAKHHLMIRRWVYHPASRRLRVKPGRPWHYSSLQDSLHGLPSDPLGVPLGPSALSFPSDRFLLGSCGVPFWEGVLFGCLIWALFVWPSSVWLPVDPNLFDLVHYFLNILL